MGKIKLQKIVGKILDIIASKIVHEWNGHLEIFSLPQAIAKTRHFLLFRTDISQKTVVVAPVHWYGAGRRNCCEDKDLLCTFHIQCKSYLIIVQKSLNFGYFCEKNFQTS